MVDTPVAPLAPPTILPPVHDHQYHPDHPGPLGLLIHALHARLIALEIELGFREKPVPTAPVVTPVPVTPIAPVVVTPTAPVAAPSVTV